ncbi:MAG: response regulator, partial [Deltaproteobacteria bacterium]|nr:response regulator [Deltaproteobacteria bacterium]
GHIYELNPKFAEIGGRTVEEMIKTDWMSITHPNDVQEDLDNMALLNAGKINGFNMDKRYIRPDGSHVWINMTIAPVAVEDKAHPRHLCMIDDITEQKEAAEERKQLQAQLQQAQKMEAIATLAGGVAHEFNNTLMGIMGNIELLKMNFSEDGGIDKYLEAMKSAGHRMSRLTDQLLAYAEGGKYQPKDLKMDDFVMETLPILHHDLSPEVKVETHFPKDISYIRADYAQMQMVLSAIFTNSNEAIEDEGLIRITAENKNVDVDFAEQHHDLKPGPYVCLTIEDDGKGMDEETKDGIFEPFFTTKFQGRGMGMAAVYGIVKNHDGWISVDSELGKGTTVQIYLPAIEVEVEKPKKAKAEVATGSGTILMIEDEDVVIEVTQAMLEMLGYRVMVAKTGKDAIHIAETFDGQLDLALLDIKLPDMEGGKVYPHIMKARPDLKVIVFSGYSIEGPARKILDAGAQDFIQKPFSLATLSEKLKEVLEGK